MDAASRGSTSWSKRAMRERSWESTDHAKQAAEGLKTHRSKSTLPDQSLENVDTCLLALLQSAPRTGLQTCSSSSEFWSRRSYDLTACELSRLKGGVCSTSWHILGLSSLRFVPMVYFMVHTIIWGTGGPQPPTPRVTMSSSKFYASEFVFVTSKVTHQIQVPGIPKKSLSPSCLSPLFFITPSLSLPLPTFPSPSLSTAHSSSSLRDSLDVLLRDQIEVMSGRLVILILRVGKCTYTRVQHTTRSTRQPEATPRRD
jgi:hypothetical protein